ncbi:MAG TPA: Ldh family oxidoreductase [Candidatus Saccharimonadales bacterium]|nr:Ldh family oxidoreductase [Candidatus Saccharimonadales bacterium]
MKIQLTELREKVFQFLSDKGLNEKDAHAFTELVVEQELIGNRFSTIGELAGKHMRLIEKAVTGKEETAVEKNAVKLIKGNGRSAVLITNDYLDDTIDKAKQKGMYALGIYDSTYNEFFDIFCRRIAAQDCIGIIVENGGPQGVVPFGGRNDITGTNPLAYGIPTHDKPIVFDAAMAMHAWGGIRLAKEAGQKLPDNAYVDKDGNVTTDPEIATAVLPFGGYKGYALNLLVDVLSGCLVRGRSGLDQPTDSERYIGTFIIVIDPASFGDLDDFKDSTTKLVNDLLASPPANPDEPVRVPGLRGAKRRTEFIEAGEVEIDDAAWDKFMAAFSTANKQN